MQIKQKDYIDMTTYFYAILGLADQIQIPKNELLKEFPELTVLTLKLAVLSLENETPEQDSPTFEDQIRYYIQMLKEAVSTYELSKTVSTEPKTLPSLDS